jgi:di/tricarboxylate transporter
MELVVRTESRLQGRSARDIQLRTRYGLNLLAVSREGSRMKARLRTLKIRAGDLLLMQGAEEALSDFAADNGCVPLAERELRIPDRGKALAASLIMLAAVAAAALSLLPTAIAFAAGVLATMALRTLPLRAVYDAIDWPVIVLLGALMPVAAVMENTGTAALVAELLLEQVAGGSAPLAIGLILTLTMLVSCVVNNAATAAAMCPIALGAAATLGVSDDAFLMAVAIGASCAFLTPIGHQNNTLILGPGGFHFSDYWRLGLPVSLLVVLISVPLLLWVWPL